MFDGVEDTSPPIGHPQYNKQDDEEGMQADRRASVAPMVDKEIFFQSHETLSLA